MSQDGAAYRFLPWVRRGAAAQVTDRDLPTTPGTRATLPVTVTFNSGAAALVGATALELLGPGDVVGFDARAISQTWPPVHTLDAEPNYFPAVEFDQVDLPWRYTPRAEDAATGRLRPWLCLLTFQEGELDAFVPARADRPLESVTIKPGAPLPPPEQLWAWSHAQVSGDDDTTLVDVVTLHPERCLARLLSPRRLDARTTYWALLVPTFEIGRRAGLREPLAEAASSLAAAWTATTVGPAGLAMPIYHRWKFTTGAGGDFESLARRLTPRQLPPTVGTRALDASQPGGGLPAASPAPLRQGGALQRPGAAPTPGPEAAFVDALASVLDGPADVIATGGTPIVAPPLYGHWHARCERLAPAGAPPWFHDLNADPRARIAAALGTEIVQTQQHELMASAWAQVAGLREANAQLRVAQVARAVSERLHRRFIRTAAVEDVLVLTAAVHGRVRTTTPRTVRSRVDASPPRFALLSGAMRRLARSLGPLGRRQARPDRAPAPVVGRVNDGTYAAVLAPTPPPLTKGAPTLAWLETVTGAPLPTADQLAAAPASAEGLVWDPVDGEPPRKWPTGDDKGTDSPSMAAFRAAAMALAGRNRTPAAGGEVRRLDLPALRASVAAAIDPRTAIPDALGLRATRSPDLVGSPSDPIEPVMAHPVFPQPMYKPLAELSPDWMLPGLFELAPDTVTLAETNPAFIEAYLIGLNHEMSRELLWREYPSDQRGSYFRQFWDPAGLAPTPVPEAAKDIAPLHGWSPQSALGAHSPRPAPPGGKHLVLVVRGELLRRYPGTLVYAQRAAKTAAGYRLADVTREPVFAGRMRPDVAFFGFALTDAEVRGAGTALDPGWFFVFQEQPGAPRFGLDEAQFGPSLPAPASWAELAWSHLAPSPAALAAVHYIDLAVTREAIEALEVPAGLRWHLTSAAPGARGPDHAAITCQQPVRVALHAAQLLP